MLALAAGITSVADPLPREKQQEIIDNYLFVTGRTNQIPSQALAGENPEHPWPHIVKCGMSAVADFVLNRDRIDRELLAEAGVLADQRPALSREYGSPSGRFLVHYEVTGTNAVYQPTVVNGNGVPLYVVSVGDILDSVYTFIIDSLGYPPPPLDGFYPSGGDDRFDVYLLNLSSGFYGLSYIDSTQIDGPGTIRATSYMELDATYEGLPQYANRPLDAVRVTAAHEYFHSVQFGIDFTEADIYNENFVARYWMEQSSVYMEEAAYPDINDYYNYLPWFFDDPRNSIQQFRSYTDPRPYAAGIWPMYLADVYGDDIIREIWLRCGEYGVGPDYLARDTFHLSAAQVVIDSMSNHESSWATEYRNFMLRNWFTGPRAANAPDAYSWPLEERTAFPAFPDSMVKIWKDYPITQLGSDNTLNPLHNGAHYIKFADLYLVTYDTGYFNCTAYYDSTCTDSTEVFDPGLGYDFLHVDSTFHDTTYWDCGVYSDSVCGDSSQVTSNDSWDFFHVRKRTPTSREDTTYWRCDSLVDYRCIDSIAVEDTTAGYDFTYVDSILDLSMGVGLSATVPPLVEPWGVSIIYQLESNPDSFEVDRGYLPDKYVTRLGFPNPYQYRSIVMALTPATWSGSRDYFKPFPFRVQMAVGYQAEVEIDASQYYNLRSAVLAPYPNPAEVNRMGSAPITFRFQVQTDSAGVPIYDPSNGYNPYLVIDIYTIAGERVRTVNGTPADVGRGTYELEWDMRNESGKDVASGAYIVYGRLYNNDAKEELLAEDHSKVAVIR